MWAEIQTGLDEMMQELGIYEQIDDVCDIALEYTKKSLLHWRPLSEIKKTDSKRYLVAFFDENNSIDEGSIGFAVVLRQDDVFYELEWHQIVTHYVDLFDTERLFHKTKNATDGMK